MIRLPSLLLTSLALLLGGCVGDASKVYALDGATAYRRVAAAEVPTGIFGSSARGSISTSRIDAPGQVVRPVLVNGQEIFRYVAAIEVVDAGHTRVAVALQPAPSGEIAQRVGTNLKANADIARPYHDAMAEAVDASVMQRPFQFAAIAPAMTIAVIGRFDEINANFDKAIAAHDKQ